MKYISRLRKILLSALLILAIMLPAQAESFQAIVTSSSMKVYSDAARTKKIGALGQYTVVTVDAYSGGTAKISLKGKTGYAPVSSMEALSSVAEPATVNTDTRVYAAAKLSSRSVKVAQSTQVNLIATKGQWAMLEKDGVIGFANKNHITKNSDAAAPQDEVVKSVFTAHVSSSSMKVYKSASASSKKLGTLKQNTEVTVHAYNRKWAYIELNGNYGFALISDMTKGKAPSVTPDKTPEPAVPDTPSSDHSYLDNSSYSTEYKIYLFLTRELKLNTAAACGILANIERECDFNYKDLSYGISYGICQWTYSRLTRLKSWTKENGYDYTTLEGQLWYLKYELENHYTSTLKYMRNVSNTASGAYDGGHYWCYYFEVPASRSSRSVERGNIAKNKYWEKYAA